MKCTVVLADGRPCPGNIWRGSQEFCFLHDHSVEAEKKRRDGCMRGGFNSRPERMQGRIEKSDDDDVLIMDSLRKALANAQDLQKTPEGVRALAGAADQLDKVIERQRKRGIKETIIRVEYINDWRNVAPPDGETALPS